jgi:hypothetical protein
LEDRTWPETSRMVGSWILAGDAENGWKIETVRKRREWLENRNWPETSRMVR